MTTGDRRERRPIASLAIFLCVAGFVALEALAIRAYPGGTFWDPSARGASFWENFLCDLESPIAIDGVPNPLGSRLARAAMVLLVVGMGPFWWSVPRLFAARSPLTPSVRTLGLASLGGIVAVVLLPSSRYGRWHGAAVLLAAAPGIAATTLAVAGLASGGARSRAAGLVGALLFAAASLDVALYIPVWYGGGPGPRLLPITQKVALGLLLAWMLIVGWRSARLRSGA